MEGGSPRRSLRGNRMLERQCEKGGQCMANRDNRYEAAFEAYLRAKQVPYVADDETRRASLAADSPKSLDYIVSAAHGAPWLVDVKGRLFPSGEQRQYWKNWSTRDDLVSLAQW